MTGIAKAACVAAILWGAVATGQEAPPLPDRAMLEQVVADFDLPGLAMANIERCEAQDTLGVGMANIAKGIPVTDATAFEAASLTKPVFAYIVMTLVEDGVIDLDRPIADGFDYARIADADAYAKLTPRMVLTHRTGLPNWVDEGTEFHDRTAPIPFIAQPGTTFTYSGEAFQLLQAFVERETGESLQSLFAARLGEVMPNSTLARPLPESVIPSRGYARASQSQDSRGMDNLSDRAMAASSLVTTARDYARFLSHICQGRGLTDATRADMLRPQSPAPAEEMQVGDYPPPPPTSWGLGWMIVDLGEDAMVGHGGSNDEYNAFGGFLRDGGDGIVLLTNGATGEHAIQAILSALR